MSNKQQKQDIKKTKLWNKILPIVLFSLFCTLWITTIILCFFVPLAAAIIVIVLGLGTIAGLLLIMWENKKGFWNKKSFDSSFDEEPATDTSKVDTTSIDI